MSENRDILIDAANRLLADHVTKPVLEQAEAGTWPAELWSALEDNGLTLASVPEAQGGVGGGPLDELAVLRAAGRAAAPVPLAETMLAGWLLAGASLKVPFGPLSIAPVRPGETLGLTQADGGWLLAGKVTRIPWGAAAAHVAVLAKIGRSPHVALVPRQAWQAVAGHNLAGEPRDTLTFAGVKLAPEMVARVGKGVDFDALFARGALVRAAQISGALDHILDLAVRYASERVQFGRAIGRFQAVQQQLAVLAGHCAAAGKAVDAAYEALEQGGNADVEIAVAKARGGEAAGICAGIAQQVHGAIGFTHEHTLHYSTRRLWSWRDEFGSESHWQIRLGRRVAAAGADALWPFLTGTDT